MHFFINYNQLASEWCKFYWQLSTKKWVKKDFEKYRISYVLIVDFADPEIILAGECSMVGDTSTHQTKIDAFQTIIQASLINNSKFKNAILFFLININKICLENWQMLHVVWDITVQSLVNLYSEQKFEMVKFVSHELWINMISKTKNFALW